VRKLTQFKKTMTYANPSDTAGLYLVITMLDKTTYLFDAAFIHLIRYALTSFCTSEMTSEQLDLFLDYIDEIGRASCR